MKLEDLLERTCVIGVSYFDLDGSLMRQVQYAGQVHKVDAEHGISVHLRHSDPSVPSADFIVPPNLDAWFKAPPGHYKHPPSGVNIENPDFLVAWDVHRTQESTPEGQHEWWDWVPNVQSPQVGSQPPNPAA
jgi:hypothetical protein